MKHSNLFLCALFLLVFEKGLYAMNTAQDEEREERKTATRLLFKAIDTNKSLDMFLEMDPYLNDTQLKGYSPLAYAIRKGALQAVDSLLIRTDLYALSDGINYLHEALYTRNINIIYQTFDSYNKKDKRFLAIIDAEDSNKNTPFHLTAEFLRENIKDVKLTHHLLIFLKTFKAANGNMEKANVNGKTVNAILKEAQKTVTKYRQLNLGWSDLSIAMKGKDLTLEGEDFDAMSKAYETYPLQINVQNVNGTTAFHIVAFKYVKFIEQEDEEKLKACWHLLQAMIKGGGQLELKNKAGDSVRTVLGVNLKGKKLMFFGKNSKNQINFTKNEQVDLDLTIPKITVSRPTDKSTISLDQTKVENVDALTSTKQESFELATIDKNPLSIQNPESIQDNVEKENDKKKTEKDGS